MTDAEAVSYLQWKKDVEHHDYAAASTYLSIRFGESRAQKVAEDLQSSRSSRAANDILRATGLDPAPLDDPGVLKDLIKVIEGKRLSPVLVMNQGGRARIADGFHRTSLVYRIDPYGVLPLKLV